MRRVGIMSMQRIRNYGSSLQAYALKRTIESFGAEVSFLDFEPGPALVGSDAPGSPVARTLAKMRQYAGVDARFVDRLRFFDHKRGYSSRYLPMLGIGDDPGPGAALDVQVIGSDEVFNCFQGNANVGYSPDLFGRSRRAPRLVSYAASFGNTTLARIDDAGLRPEIAADLEGFDALSVRDRNSAEIVRALCGIEPYIHVDPVLVHDWSTDCRVPAGRMSDDPYVIVYGYPGRFDAAENAAIERFAAQASARVVCIGGVQASGDRFVDCSPLEVFAWFRGADAVVTDTFHGTIFAMVAETPFATIVRTTRGAGYGNEEKLSFLLKTFGVTDRRVTDPHALGSVVGRPYDIDGVREAIQRERLRSVSYLSEQVATGDVRPDSQSGEERR